MWKIRIPSYCMSYVVQQCARERPPPESIFDCSVFCAMSIHFNCYQPRVCTMRMCSVYDYNYGRERESVLYAAVGQQSKRSIYPISAHKINERKSTESKNKNDKDNDAERLNAQRRTKNIMETKAEDDDFRGGIRAVLCSPMSVCALGGVVVEDDSPKRQAKIKEKKKINFLPVWMALLVECMSISIQRCSDGISALHMISAITRATFVFRLSVCVCVCGCVNANIQRIRTV